MLNRCLNSGRLQHKLLHVQRLSFIYLNCVTVEEEGKTKEITECKNHSQYLYLFLTPVEFKVQSVSFQMCLYFNIFVYFVSKQIKIITFLWSMICLIHSLFLPLIVSSRRCWHSTISQNNWVDKEAAEVNNKESTWNKVKQGVHVTGIYIQSKETWKKICMDAWREADTFCPYLENHHGDQ